MVLPCGNFSPPILLLQTNSKQTYCLFWRLLRSPISGTTAIITVQRRLIAQNFRIIKLCAEEFKQLVLKAGKSIFLPFTALSSSRYKRNAFSTMANIFFFSENRIQRAIMNDERRAFSV